MIGKTRLRQLREERNLKQTTVAQETGLSRGTISNYESGMTPSTANGTILAAYYGVSLDYILGLTDERNADVGGISKSFAVLNKLTDGKGPSASDVAALLDASVAYLCNGAPCGMTPHHGVEGVHGALDGCASRCQQRRHRGNAGQRKRCRGRRAGCDKNARHAAVQEGRETECVK